MELLGGPNELIYMKCWKELLAYSNIIQELAIVVTVLSATWHMTPLLDHCP